MSRPKKKAIPGSVFKRSTRETLYIKFKGKEIATGFKDTPLGRKLAQQQLEKLYFESLRNEGIMEQSENIRVHWTTFKSYKALRVNKRTLADYELSINKANILACKLNRTEIENAILSFVNTSLQEKKLHPRSINIYLRNITVFINYLTDKELLPKIKVSKYKIEAGQKQYMNYNEAEFTMLYDYFETIDREFALFLKFMRFTGSRRKETLELSWEQINLKKRTISFPVKNRKMQIDTFPITKEIEEILLELRANNGDKVFRWKESSASRLSRRLIAAEEKLGIRQEGRGFHGLRKSFAESLFSNNKSLSVTRRLMRHKSIDTTIKHYNNYTDKELLSELENVRQMSPNSNTK